MAILWCRESVKDRRFEVGKDSGGTASRSFLVRVDDPTESLSAIRAETGITIGTPFPSDTSLACEKISVRASDSTGMLYEVSVDYKPLPSNSDNNEDPQEPGSLPGLIPVWGGSSSVKSEPIYRDSNQVVMTNSAGDPLEGLEAEQAIFHLTLTQYYESHTDWMPLARDYTNTVNDLAWNGGAPGQWKCQGCSAKLNIDNQGEDGSARIYWEVNWDFAWNSPDWNLHPWDIGFNELVDASGNPVEVPGISSGSYEGSGGGSGSGGDGDGPCGGGLGRRAILGQDGKPVRQPVALENGKARPPCLRPIALEFEIYDRMDFMVPFGEVRTPTV